MTIHAISSAQEPDSRRDTRSSLLPGTMKALGADVILVDGAIEEALTTASDFAARTGAVLVEDSKDIGTCEGAGTIGLELANGAHPLDAVLIALGAGAMATGVGYALKYRCPEVQVLTVQPVLAPGMTLSLRAGHVIDAGPPDTIADGVAGRCVIPEVLDDLASVATDAFLVTEESIKEGLRLLYRHSGLIVESAASLGIASILENRKRFRSMTVATILCGSNISLADFERWVS